MHLLVQPVSFGHKKKMRGSIFPLEGHYITQLWIYVFIFW